MGLYFSSRKLTGLSMKPLIKFPKQVQDKVELITKPESCESCPYRTIGSGFCPDEFNSEAKIAVLLEAPGEDEILYHRPLWGRAGRAWLYQLVVKNGRRREDVTICNTLRCRPHGNGTPKDKWNDYPKGKLRTAAEKYCRQYDDVLVSWKPDCFVVTIHPAALLRTSAFTRLVRKDVAKAFALADKGYRPLVLMGDKAMHLSAPHLRGGVKNWRGHWWFGELHRRYET